MEVQGIITKVCKNNIAKILIERSSACGGNCKSCENSCGGKSYIFARYSQNLKEGDKVIIESRSNKVIFLSLAVFILPLITMVIAYKLFFKFIANEEILSLISLFLGILVFVVTVLIFRKLKMPSCRKI